MEELLRSRAAVESFAVEAVEELSRKKGLALPVDDAASTVLLINGAEVESSNYEFIADDNGKAGMVLHAKLGWKIGDQVLLIYRRKMFDLYGELMRRAVEEGVSRTNAKSFAEITQQQHEWVVEIFAKVFEALDLKLREIDEKLDAIKQAHNAHVHSQGDAPQTPSVLIE